MKKLLLSLLVLVSASLAGGVWFISSGFVDVAADNPHSPFIFNLISWVRDAAITRESSLISPPSDLFDAIRIRRGAGNYAAMCAGCHLIPGTRDSEIRQGLYPQPPNLSLPPAADDLAKLDARRFWIIKHGIKASGMPAWGLGGMSDRDIWDLTAFLKVLPNLSATQYHQLVAASDGHVHEGMEHEHHGHDHHSH